MPVRWFITLLFLLVASGCARWNKIPVDYRAISDTGDRNAEAAEALHAEAIAKVSRGDRDDAVQLLNQALINDQTYGPAHNTLGKLHFDRGKFYLAAIEFQEAKKLMPSRCEPLNNLGLVYESVGQAEKAISYFSQGLAVCPNNPQLLGNLIRARIRSGDRTSDLRPMLEQLVEIDDRPSWRSWAKETLALQKIDRVSEYSEFPIEEFIEIDGATIESLPEPMQFEPGGMDAEQERSQRRQSARDLDALTASPRTRDKVLDALDDAVELTQ